MPKLTGVFESFEDLDKIPISDIKQWLKAKEQDFYLENYIGNRLLYPQTIAVTAWDMEIDLAILREHIRRNVENYYDKNENKLIIPEEFVARFAPVPSLISAVVDILNIQNITTTIMLKKHKSSFVAGSLIILPKLSEEDFFALSVDDQQMRFKTGTMQLIPIQDSQVKINVESMSTLFIPGGLLGILLDLRQKDKN